MICTHCGKEINDSKFCPNCGFATEENQKSNQIETLDNNLNNSINSNTESNSKIMLIIAIVIPIIALVLYCTIGIPFYLAIVAAAIGESFAKKGENTNRKLALVGKILNWVLAIIMILTLIVQIISTYFGN